MNFSKLTDDLAIISKLGDNPGADNGLTAEGLKAKFDEAALIMQAYLNGELVEKLNEIFAGGDSKPNDGLNMIGPINMNGNPLQNLRDPASPGEAISLGYALAHFLDGNRKINGKPLSEDVVLNADDVGARPATWLPTPAELGAAPASHVADHVADKTNPHEVTAAQVGATAMTLLWENASPTSSFEPQNIAVPVSAYDYIMVEGLNSANWNGLAHTMSRIGHHGTLYNGSSTRAVKLFDSYVEFFNGKDIGTGAVSSDKMIPQKIWGIKGIIGHTTIVPVPFGDVTMDDGYYVDFQTGEVKTTPMQSATRKYISVEPGATYKLDYTGSETSVDINACFYKADKGYTYDGDSSSSDFTVKGGTYSLLKKEPPITFTVPSGCYYMRFHSSGFSDITDWHLYKLRGD